MASHPPSRAKPVKVTATAPTISTMACIRSV
jgi:hypothetical protein